MAPLTTSISEVALDTLLQAKGDRELAIKMLLAKCDKDAALRKAVLGNSLELRCIELITAAVRQIRKDVRGGGIRPSSGLPVNPFYAPLPDGTPLGKATRIQLQAAADFHQAQIKGHQRIRHYYLAIANHMKNDKETVEEAYTQEALREILQSLE